MPLSAMPINRPENPIMTEPERARFDAAGFKAGRAARAKDWPGVDAASACIHLFDIPPPDKIRAAQKIFRAAYWRAMEEPRKAADGL